MERRRFLAGSLALAAVGSLGSAQGREVSPRPICRAPFAAMPASTRARGAGLVYEGSYILTYGAFREIANRYRGPVPLAVHGGGCDNAILGVRQGAADLGGMCCPVAGSRGEGLPSLIIAHDIKVVVAHPDVPIADISRGALKAVAAGRLSRWRELGGGDEPIALVVREHCEDYAEPVRTALIERGRSWSPRALFVDTDDQLVDAVARFPRAIGVGSWVFAKPLAEAGRLKVLSLDGIAPSRDTVRSGAYGLTSPLSLIFRAWRPEMGHLFDYVYGPEGRAIISQRLVPVSAEEAGYAGA